MVAETGDTPIALGTTESAILEHFKVRVEALGNRITKVNWSDDLPDWAQWAPCVASRDVPLGLLLGAGPTGSRRRPT
eukprot:7069871-Alexandrium_andersonii.AAC.1